jgi:hypothetical protein
MAVKRIIDKRGRVLYFDTDRGRFTKAGQWVKENLEIIGKGPSKIHQLDDLTDKEKRSFRTRNFQKENPYRWEGKFLSRAANETLRKLGYKPGEMKGKISRGEIDAIKENATKFTDVTFIKNAVEYERTRGDLMSTTKYLFGQIRRGAQVEVVIEGEVFEGKEGLLKLNEWQRKFFDDPEVEAVRITYVIDKVGKKRFVVSTEDAQVDLFKTTP